MALRVNRVWGVKPVWVLKLSPLATSGSHPCCGTHPLADGEDAGWHSLGDVTDSITGNWLA
jgi:hypothetical protein